jgi:hypothetical protein
MTIRDTLLEVASQVPAEGSCGGCVDQIEQLLAKMNLFGQRMVATPVKGPQVFMFLPDGTVGGTNFQESFLCPLSGPERYVIDVFMDPRVIPFDSYVPTCFQDPENVSYGPLDES